MKKMSLQEILAKEKEKRTEGGMFGIRECKDSIKHHIETNEMLNRRAQENVYPTSLYVLLEEYVNRANNDVFFNRAMVLACWELINEQ